MPDAMTPKERWLAALRLEPVDRIPFWPKLDGAYPRHREGRFADADLDSLHEWIGSDRHEPMDSALTARRTTTSVDMRRDGDTRVTTFGVPGREMRRVDQFDNHSQAWHPVRFPMHDLADIRGMTAWYSDAEWRIDEDRLRAAEERYQTLGDDCLMFTCFGQSPLMHWVEWLAGIENAHYLLKDHPAEVSELFEAMHGGLVRCAELLAERSPADAAYLSENTSTTLISVEQYRGLNKPHIMEYARVLADGPPHLVLHMCGHLKALLPDLAEVPCRGFESFTRPTLGNTTLEDGRSVCRDKCLVGGTQAMDWLRPAREIIGIIESALEPLPHHRGIVVTSAGVMPPYCEPETIREVCRWLAGHAARN
ncbi:MAG: hypothetical protein GF320_11555 [Armatimonadia bacterium]|nr:hypothetical protein [Armatimonadia bacterium]